MPRSTMVDMTEGSIWRHLAAFAFPLFIGNIFQQLYNTVDSVVVGRFVGADALGAVTSTIPIVFMLIGLAIGLTMGASVVISQAFGAKDLDRLRRSVHTSVVATVLLSVVVSAVGYLATPLMLRLMATPPPILREAVVYLQIYFLGAGGLMLYNMGSAILRSVGDSKRPLFFLILSSLINIALDLLFIIQFGMGVAGVAWATIVSQYASALVIFWLLFRSEEPHGLSWSEMAIDRDILLRIVRIGLPSGLQMAITSFSNVFVQAYINAFGAASTSGWGIYSRIDAFVILPIQSMSMSVTTFVGQNAGALKADRIRQGVREGMAMSIGVTVMLVALIYLTAPSMVALFNRDEAVVRHAVLFLQLNSLFDPLNAVYLIYAGALRGVGDAKAPMAIMLGSFVVSRQIYLFVVSRLTGSIHAIALGYPMGWLVCAALMAWHVRRSGWERKLALLASR